MPGLTPVEFGDFGGLDVRNDPQEVSSRAAVDLLNVDFSVPGTIQCRPNTVTFKTEAAEDYIGMAPFYGLGVSAEALIAATSTKLYAYNTVSLATSSSLTGLAAATEVSFASIGLGSSTLSDRRCYIARGGSKLYRFDASPAFTLTGVNSGRCLAVTPWDNRLVIGGYNTFDSRVQFSDAGAPETMGANNWVDLTPGDGDLITTMAVYGRQLFVFKKRKFFVFYGTQTDGQGNPIFNYEAVDYGIGCESPYGATVGPDGVYFVSPRGVYRATGPTAPVRVSEAINPLFRIGDPTDYYTGPDDFRVSELVTPTCLTYNDGKLYLSTTRRSSSSTYWTLVLDLPTNRWSLWNVNARAMTTVASSAEQYNAGSAVYFAEKGTKKLRVIPSTTVFNAFGDESSAPTAYYRSGFWNPGQPGAETIVHEWLIDGISGVYFQTAVNDAAALGAQQFVDLGSSAVSQGRDVRAVRGRNVSFQITGSPPLRVSRVVANVWGQNDPGLKSA